MSRARHKRAKGGAMVYAGGNSNVLKEAEERKRGGKVMHGEGEEGKERHDRRKRGGRAERKHGGKMEEAMERKRGGAVPGRKRGGGVGADKMPLSSAAKIKEVTPGEQALGANED